MRNEVLDGKYQVVRRIGQGHMGEVYEAIHSGTGRRVAVKVLFGFRGVNSAEMVGRFQREARLAGAVETVHIVDVLDTGQDRDTGMPFMVMELLVGEDLKQLLDRTGPLPVSTALRILAQACLGLQKAHEAGIVHRDVKPANIFLAREGNGEIVVKLLDFGVAKMKQGQLASSEHALTKTGSLLGSPLYMSPEQANGDKHVDGRSDIWSLGVVGYQLVTGRTPHDGIEALGKLLVAIGSQPAQPVHELAPWVPAEMADILHRALAIAPTQRFPTARAMGDAIVAFLQAEPGLGDSMLVAVSDEERQRRPARPGPGSGANAASGERLRRVFAHTFSALGRTMSRGGAIPLGALGVGLVVFAFTLRSGWSTFASSSPKEAITMSMAPASSSPNVEPAATEPTLAAPLHVRVQIVPGDAAVLVDGKGAVIHDGAIDIDGAPDSIHHVEVAKGKWRTEQQVLLSSAGPIPFRVELVPASPSGSASSQPDAKRPSVARPASHRSADAPALSAPVHSAAPVNPEPPPGPAEPGIIKQYE